MDLPRPSADVLEQGTRARLFSLLEELRRPAPTEELAQQLDLHPNGVRVHLERLVEAGLVLRRRERRPRGRPRDVWSIAPDAQPGGAPPTAYADLGRWLARTISDAQVSIDEIEAMGRAIGRELAPAAGPGTAVDQLSSAFAALGFQPRTCGGAETGSAALKLGNCPYRAAAGERQAVVCGLHRGITCGLLETIEPSATLARFEPRDPDRAGCLVEVCERPAPADDRPPQS